MMAMGVSVVAGFTLEKLGFEKYVKKEAYEEPAKKGCGSSCGGTEKPVSKWVTVWHSTWKDAGFVS